MQPVATYRVTIQYNTKKAFYEAHMVSQNLRCRQSLGGKDDEAGLREGTGKIICFKVPFKRGKR